MELLPEVSKRCLDSQAINRFSQIAPGEEDYDERIVSGFALLSVRGKLLKGFWFTLGQSWLIAFVVVARFPGSLSAKNLWLVQAARSGTARRRHRYQPVMATPWQRRESDADAGDTGDLRHQRCGVRRDAALGRFADESVRGEPDGVGCEFRSLHADGALVEAADFLLCAHRHYSHCVQHVVPVVARRIGGAALWARYIRMCLSSVRHLGEPGSVLWHRDSQLSAGASGAIFGIAGAVIASIKLGEFASGVMAQGTMQSLIAFVGYNVVFGAISGRTDNACHFGGLPAGWCWAR